MKLFCECSAWCKDEKGTWERLKTASAVQALNMVHIKSIPSFPTSHEQLKEAAFES